MNGELEDQTEHSELISEDHEMISAIFPIFQ